MISSLGAQKYKILIATMVDTDGRRHCSRAFAGQRR